MDKDVFIGNFTTIGKFVFFLILPYIAMSSQTQDAVLQCIPSIGFLIYALIDAKYPNYFKSLGNGDDDGEGN